MNKKKVLVTGGAGYVGSHTAYALSKAGYHVIIIDNLSHQQPFAFPWAECIIGDFSDSLLLTRIFSQNTIEAVFHFAAYIEVGESVKNPQKFYENNVAKTLQLLNIMFLHNVKTFIFSSSCAVYGNPQYLPLNEDHPKNPVSPYGRTKLMVEQILEDYATAYHFSFAALRYFNAAGASPELGLGERHLPESHLIPRLLYAAHTNTPFKLFGTQYPTKDGSCIRDYIHVKDLATAHLLAFEYVNKTKESIALNIGTGTGYSVKEMIATTQETTHTKISIDEQPARAGDAKILVADPTKAMFTLGFKPQYSTISAIIQTAYEFFIHTNKQ